MNKSERIAHTSVWLDCGRTDFRRSPRHMYRIRGNACDGVHPVSSRSSLGICIGGLRGQGTVMGGDAFSGIAEVLRNRSSGLV